MHGEITQLLELQSMDLKLTELSFQLKRHATHRQAVEQKIADEHTALECRKEEHAALEHESRMRNLDVDELDENIRGYQKRLDKGIISFKEMEDLRTKISSDRRRMEVMEDSALELMDRIEVSKAEIARAETDLAERVSKLQAMIAEIDAQRGDTQSQLENLKLSRDRAKDAMPTYLVSQYETLRAEFSEPLTTIHHGTCAGCKLKLSGGTVERARGGLGLVTCEHCNRILYVD